MDKINETYLLIFATIIVIGCFVLLGLGRDGFTQVLLGSVVGFFFGIKVPNPSGGMNTNLPTS
jgi:hypothetical protein